MSGFYLKPNTFFEPLTQVTCPQSLLPNTQHLTPAPYMRPTSFIDTNSFQKKDMAAQTTWSRRGLLSSFFLKTDSKPYQNTTPLEIQKKQETPSSPQTPSAEITRRSFTQTATALLGTIMMGGAFEKTAEAQDKKQRPTQATIPQKAPQTDLEDTFDAAQELAAEWIAQNKSDLSEEMSPHLLFSTFLESIVTYLGGSSANILMQKLGVPYGNKSLNPEKIDSTIKKYPILFYLSAGMIMPAIEEVLFRYGPAKIFSGQAKGPVNWQLGIPMVALFAVAHNFRQEFKWHKTSHFPYIEKLSFNLDFYISNPISQFILGAYCWFAMRQKGLTHAILAHSLFNSIAIFKEYQELFADESPDQSSKNKP